MTLGLVEPGHTFLLLKFKSLRWIFLVSTTDVWCSSLPFVFVFFLCFQVQVCLMSLCFCLYHRICVISMTSVTHLYLYYICDFFMTSVAHLYRGANEEDRVAHCPCLGRSQSCKTTLGKPATAALEKYRTGEKRNTELRNSEILLRRRLAVNSVN